MHNGDVGAWVTAGVDIQRNKGSPHGVGWTTRTCPTGMRWILEGVHVGMGLEGDAPVQRPLPLCVGCPVNKEGRGEKQSQSPKRSIHGGHLTRTIAL